MRRLPNPNQAGNPADAGVVLFSKDLQEMSRREMLAILECILHEAEPGALAPEPVFAALLRAESNAFFS